MFGLYRRPDLQIAIRGLQAKLFKKYARHSEIVVLAGMHQHRLNACATSVCRLNRVAHRRSLDELRTRTDHCEELHQAVNCGGRANGAATPGVIGISRTRCASSIEG